MSCLERCPVSRVRGSTVNFNISLQFQSAPLGEGAIEMTPLGQAAGKGLDNMVQLLLDNGADINYLCSVSCRFMSNLNGMISCSRNTVRWLSSKISRKLCIKY